MKTKRLTPRNAAPVKRENAATSTNAGVISPSWVAPIPGAPPFAGDDAE
ncbi:MAG: anacyclamide/piricyclamide family prenylated cyclic peptide [Cyanobacteria bacterium J06632_19]